MKWFWLSFADGDLPEGEQFLGAIIIDVSDKDVEMIVDVDSVAATLRGRGQEEDLPFYCAVMRCHLLGINPGGEVQGREIPEFMVVENVPVAERRKLLSRERVATLGWVMVGG